MKKVAVIAVFLFASLAFCAAAEQSRWMISGNVAERGKASFGQLYKAAANESSYSRYAGRDRLNALTVPLYRNVSRAKKDPLRFAAVSFYLRFSPFTRDYDAHLADSKAPFRKLNFGFSFTGRKADTYNDLAFFATGSLHGSDYFVFGGPGCREMKISPYILLKKAGGGNVSGQASRPHVLNPYVTFSGVSSQYAPVLVQIVHDRRRETLSVYLNGVRQNRIPLGGVNPQNRKIASVSLFWARTNKDRKSETYMFELSPPSVYFGNAEPVTAPKTLTPPRINAEHHDSFFENTLALLYGPRNDWEQGVSRLKKLASRKHAPAVFELACCRLRGIGGPPDRKAAARYAEEAAKLGVSKGAALWALAATAPWYRKRSKDHVNWFNEAGPLLEFERVIKLENVPKFYAAALHRTIDRIKKDTPRNRIILAELKRLADTGLPSALYYYGLECGDQTEQMRLMKTAARAGSPDAVEYLVQKDAMEPAKYSLQRRFPLRTQLLWAVKYPFTFAWPPRTNPLEQELRPLTDLYRRTKRPEAAFACAEFLAGSLPKAAPSVRREAEFYMKSAAETLPVARLRYILLYLDGFFEDGAAAEKYLKSLAGEDVPLLYLKELAARLKEKRAPGENRALWEELHKENSLWALYYLGEYAAKKGQRRDAARYRHEFLERDTARRNFSDEDGVFTWGDPGQAFTGFCN